MTQLSCNFCPNCGYSVAPSSLCECGAILLSGWSFCGACGKPKSQTGASPLPALPSKKSVRKSIKKKKVSKKSPGRVKPEPGTITRQFKLSQDQHEWVEEQAQIQCPDRPEVFFDVYITGHLE